MFDFASANTAFSPASSSSSMSSSSSSSSSSLLVLSAAAASSASQTSLGVMQKMIIQELSPADEDSLYLFLLERKNERGSVAATPKQPDDVVQLKRKVKTMQKREQRRKSVMQDSDSDSNQGSDDESEVAMTAADNKIIEIGDALIDLVNTAGFYNAESTSRGNQYSEQMSIRSDMHTQCLISDCWVSEEKLPLVIATVVSKLIGPLSQRVWEKLIHCNATYAFAVERLFALNRAANERFFDKQQPESFVAACVVFDGSNKGNNDYTSRPAAGLCVNGNIVQRLLSINVSISKIGSLAPFSLSIQLLAVSFPVQYYWRCTIQNI